jgi:hypothetical protein
LHQYNTLSPHFPACDQHHRLKQGDQVIPASGETT